ncbi:MAG: 5'-nucleotidase domain-containing protein [Bacteroidetes bacterium]|nr:MAG: 5'-nucleotidase domain-containing protein [Bacteroidota bacterium]
MKKLYTILSIAFSLGTIAANAQCTVAITGLTPTGLTVNATSSGSGAQQFPAYGWDWGDTQVTLNQQNASHTYASPGTYTVCVTYIDVLDTANCNATDCQTVTVTTTNIVEAQQFKLDAGAYPNPFGDKTSVIYTVSHPSEVTIEVYDMLGKKVASLLNDKVSAGQHTVDWNSPAVPSGLYFLQVKAGDFVINKKILKN